MIREIEAFHGYALARLVRSFPGSVEIGRYPAAGGSAYAINNQVGLLVKYSSKRLPPWIFTFTPDHLKDLAVLDAAMKQVVIALVCHKDGIVGLSLDEVTFLIGSEVERQVAISTKRRRRELYRVWGPMSEMDKKISDRDFVRRVSGYLGLAQLVEEPEGNNA
ncbi:MAG: hypothetical protein AB7N24_23165 [Dehalococcoidia bacterium]